MPHRSLCGAIVSPTSSRLRPNGGSATAPINQRSLLLAVLMTSTFLSTFFIRHRLARDLGLRLHTVQYEATSNRAVSFRWFVEFYARMD